MRTIEKVARDVEDCEQRERDIQWDMTREKVHTEVERKKRRKMEKRRRNRASEGVRGEVKGSKVMKASKGVSDGGLERHVGEVDGGDSEHGVAGDARP